MPRRCLRPRNLCLTSPRRGLPGIFLSTAPPAGPSPRLMFQTPPAAGSSPQLKFQSPTLEAFAPVQVSGPAPGGPGYVLGGFFQMLSFFGPHPPRDLPPLARKKNGHPWANEKSLARVFEKTFFWYFSTKNRPTNLVGWPIVFFGGGFKKMFLLTPK